MRYFIGIDQALQKIGLCVLSDQEEPPLLTLIRPSPKLRGTPRLLYLRDQMTEVLSPFKSSVAHAALEGQSYGSQGDLDQLGQINGIVQLVLADLGVDEPMIVPPATLKLFVTGSGAASKPRMRLLTQKTWGIDIDQDDLCDAHGLARMAQEYILKRSTLRHQIQAVYSVYHQKKRKPPVRKVLPKAL